MFKYCSASSEEMVHEEHSDETVEHLMNVREKSILCSLPPLSLLCSFRFWQSILPIDKVYLPILKIKSVQIRSK